MDRANLVAGWAAILAGMLLGAGIGLFFHREAWLGGYGTWRRRMLRLGHVALIGTGLLNLGLVASVRALALESCPPVASAGLLIGAATMPTVCVLSAWRPAFRHLFFVPVAALVAAAADLMIRGAFR